MVMLGKETFKKATQEEKKLWRKILKMAKPAQEQSNISKKPSNNNISELPKTGDASIMGFVGALLLSVGGLLINDRK